MRRLPAKGCVGARCAQVPFSPWDTLTTTICMSLVGSGAPDVYGIGFPDAKQCSTLDHRWGRTCSLIITNVRLLFHR